jgi:hypothetical protein
MREEIYRRLAVLLIAGALGACASPSAKVTLLDPARAYAPTQNVEILLDAPTRAHTKIALIEVQGTVGGTESQLLEQARRQARALGADAIVRLEVTTVYREPVKVYRPWYADPFYWRYTYGYRPPDFYPHLDGPYSMNDYRWIAGGNVQTLKAVAIRYGGA